MTHGVSLPLALTTLVCLSTLACNDDGGGDPPGSEAGEGDGDGDGDTGDTGDGDGDTGDGDGDTTGGIPIPCPGSFVPLNEAALIPWLETGEYTSWLAESSVHAGAGPHFGGVRTFVDACLEGSLNADAARPPGATAIKELYGAGDQLLGWAVMVKVEAGEGANTWYWFEVYQDTIYADGVGLGLCAGCHSGGDDFFLSPWPLQ